MEKHDQDKFKAILAGVCEIHSKRVTDQLTLLYWQSMKSVSLSQFEQAINAHMLDPDCGQFFPKPADIIKQISGTSKAQTEAVKHRAELAWGQIIHKLEKSGPYKKLELDDKQGIAAIKGMGGWGTFASATYDQLVWMKKDFFNIYDTYENTELDQLPSSLPGLVELEQHKKDKGQGMKSLVQGLKDYKDRNDIK